MIRKLLLLPRSIAVALINLYQFTLSPDHGALKELHPYGFCPHQPSCSQYAKEVVERDGLVIGILKATWRVLQCGPWKKL